MPKLLTKSLIAVVVLLFTLSVIAVACDDDDEATGTATTAPVADYPLTIADFSGIEVTIDSKPERVVALLNTVTNLVVDLGHAGLVIGTDEFTIAEHPEAFADATNVGGSLFQFDLEALTALEPDLVIMGNLGQSDFPDQLRTLGLTVLIINSPTDIDEMLEQMVTVGSVFGDAAGAERLVTDLRRRLDEVAATVAEGAPLTVFMEADQSDAAAPYSVGPGSLHDAAITLAGGQNIVNDAESPFPQINHETIIDRDPQVVLLLDSVELNDENFFAPISVAEAKSRIGWEAISAVQNDNVYPFDAASLSTGVRFIEGVERLAEIFVEARGKLSYLPGTAGRAA